MIRSACCLALCTLIAAPHCFAQRLQDRAWGKYFAAYGCTVVEGHTEPDCASLHLWHISYGYWGTTILAGKNVALAVPAHSPTGPGQWRGILYIDDTVRGNQAAALEALFRRELAPYFGPDGVEVKLAPIRFVADQGIYSLRIGPPGKKRIAAADVAANAFAWWSTDRTELAPINLKKLNRLTPILHGEAPEIIQPSLHIGHTRLNWHNAPDASWDKPGGTAILCNFEYRGEPIPDRGR